MPPGVDDVRWMLGILALAGLLVIGLVTAVATGLVSMGSLDPFAKLNAAATKPATGPVIVEPEPINEAPTESEASIAALQHAGYADLVVFLSAADAKVAGPRVSLENRGSSSYYSSRRPGSQVSEKNRIPNVLIRGWLSSEDSAEWTFECPKAGTYVITFDCVPGYNSSRKGIAAGKFQITAGKERIEANLEVDVSGRKGSSSFHLVDVGQIKLPTGRVTLRIAPNTDKDPSLPLLRSVRLYPS
jgi:hypothetical protein